MGVARYGRPNNKKSLDIALQTVLSQFTWQQITFQGAFLKIDNVRSSDTSSADLISLRNTTLLS